MEGSVRPRLSQSEQALFRSQGDPLLSVPFTYFPTSLLSRFDASLFRVLLPSAPLSPHTPLPHASAGVAVSVMSQATPCSLVCSRKRCSPCLPRGRSPCHHKRDGTGPGFVAVAPGGRPPAGGGCGWSATLPWRSGRSGYDVGLTLETGLDATHSVCRQRRCCIDAGPPSERANVP